MFSGVCVCQEGFGGVACDIDLNSPPVLTNAPIQICDLNNGVCPGEIVVYGVNFLNGDTLTCHFKQVQVWENLEFHVLD